MKNRIKVCFLALAVCFSLAACGNASNSVQDSTSIANSAQDNTANTVQDKANNSLQEKTTKESDSVKVETNNTSTMTSGNSEIEFTLTDVCFESEVYSNSDNQFSQYFPDQDGESYIVAKITIKNVGGEVTGYRIFDDITVTFDEKYNYNMQQLDLESIVMSEYWSCQPLKTVDINWVQTVPDEVKSLGCNITFSVGDVVYKY